jgi:hypothetical protein
MARAETVGVRAVHNAANEYLGLIERAENGGGPRAYANWTAPSSGQEITCTGLQPEELLPARAPQEPVQKDCGTDY